MRVRVRFVLFGAVLPAAAVLIAALVAGWRFHCHQVDELDRRLLAQAAVESVGLFDAPGGAPHVHVPDSPIADAVKEFAPAAAVYDATGRRVSRDSERSNTPDFVPLRGSVAVVRLFDQPYLGRARRVLELPILAPDGHTYTLWMGASLAPIAATMTVFYRTIFTAVGVLLVALLLTQLVVARRLAARIGGMIAFLPHLRDGATNLQVQVMLPPDLHRDELATLREAIREVATRLDHARLEQDRLLANAAHELRTPLTVLHTEIDLALRKERPADELRAALGRARTDVDRMSALASALLDLQAVRHVGFERRSGDLDAVVRETCEGLATLAETRGVELRIDARGRTPVHFDERTLRQALDNLIGNALKHAPRGTAIEVAVTYPDAAARISVTDHGVGVPLDEAERIFEPFYRIDRSRGAGLGLAITREVAARHGGRVWLDTTHAPGARFILEIAR